MRQRALLAAPLVALWCSVWSACALDTQGTIPDDGGGAAATGTGGAGGSGGSGATSTGVAGGGPGGAPATCDDGGICAPATEGFALVLDAGAACPPGWVDAAPFTTTTEAPGCSPCTCGAATGVCLAGDVELGNGCGSFTVHLDSPGAGCINVPASSHVSAEDAEPTEPACEPQVGAPIAVDSVTLCSADPGATCDGGACAPPAPTGRVCFAKTGGACELPWETLTLRPIEGDTRVCECSCEPDEASCASAVLTLHGSQNCTGDEGSAPLGEGCYTAPNITDIEAIEYAPGTWSGSCNAVPVEEGELTIGAERTFCCLQP